MPRDSAHVLPSSDNAIDLGSNANRYRNIYARTIQAVGDVGASGQGARIYAFAQSDTDRGLFLAYRARDNAGAAEAVQSGDLLGGFGFYGWNNAQWLEGAFLRASIWGTPSATDLPTVFEFGTTPAGGTGSVARWRILPDGLFVPASDESYDIGQAGGNYVRAIFTGQLTLNLLSPAQITADQNDYNPSGMDSATARASVLRLGTNGTATSGGLVLTGIAAPTAAGKLLLIHNILPGPLVLGHQNTGSSAANRIVCPGGDDLTLREDQWALLYYSSDDTRWVVVATTGRNRHEGTLPYAYHGNHPQAHSGSFALPAVSAGNAGAIAIPFILSLPMWLSVYSLIGTDTATARSCEMRLYRDKGTSVLDFVTGSDATLSFTPTVAASRTTTVSGAPVWLNPGVYWLVIRNTAAATFGLGYAQSAGSWSSASSNLGRWAASAVIPALGSTIDISGASWAGIGAATYVAAKLGGRVYGQSSEF